MKLKWIYESPCGMKLHTNENVPTEDLKELGIFGAIEKWHTNRGMKVKGITFIGK